MEGGGEEGRGLKKTTQRSLCGGEADGGLDAESRPHLQERQNGRDDSGQDGCDPCRRGSHAIDVGVEFTHGERIRRSSLMRECCAYFFATEPDEHGGRMRFGERTKHERAFSGGLVMILKQPSRWG